MKTLIKILATVVVLLLVVAFVASLYLGPIVKMGVTKAGPSVLGVPVSLERSDIQLLRGHLSLGDLVIGSPDGFKAESLFRVGEVTVDMDPLSVLSDTIHIKRIYIKEPAITYEQALTGNNIGALLANLGGDEAEPTEDKKAEEASGKKVIIDEVVVEGANVKMAVAALGGKGVSLPLPTIRLEDIGKEKEGASLTEAVTAVVSAIFSSVTSVVGSAAGLAVDGAKAATELVGQVGGAALEGAEKAGEAVIEGVGKTGAAVAEGAGKVTGAAVEGVETAGKAVAEGAGAVVGGVGKAGKSLVSGVGNLLGGKQATDEVDASETKE